MSAAGHVPLPRELAPTCSTSERNVVVPCPPRRCAGEVGRVGRNVGLRREPATVLAATSAVAGAQELDRVGNDIDRLALVSLLVLPFAPVETAVDSDGAPLREVLGAVLALRTPHGHVEVVGLLDPVAGSVLPSRVGRDAEAADGRAAVRVAQLGVAREVAREDDPVDVGACHYGSFDSALLRLSSETTCAIGRDEGARPGKFV